jgi:hypothetical protein
LKKGVKIINSNVLVFLNFGLVISPGLTFFIEKCLTEKIGTESVVAPKWYLSYLHRALETISGRTDLWEKTMSYLGNLLKNLGLLIVIGIVLLMLFPDMIRQVFGLYGQLFGPVLLGLIILVIALPRKRRR